MAGSHARAQTLFLFAALVLGVILGQVLFVQHGGHHLDDAGHWPWLDRPDLVETVAGFLAGGPEAS